MFDLREQSDELREKLARVSRATGYPPVAVFLVLYSIIIACRRLPDSWWTLSEPKPIPEDIPVHHLTAVEVCDAICRCARARVGEDAGRFFHLWGLDTGADVGRIVYGLIDEGFGTATPDDRPEQFERIPLRRLLSPLRLVEQSDED